ncbi:MAG: class IV adenylate cyclase [Ruminococcus sp.]|nr:class IV adenylate cyclase [Ruminococcus sp.]
MQTEIEARILEINKEEIIKKLENLGATFVNNYEQKRYIYDFNPVIKNKWIRLRTNGIDTTLTIKEIKSDNIDGTEELEIKVDNFEKTALILKELGYKHRAYQENTRTRYMYNNVEIDIDSWPKIPTYIELEGNSKEDIIALVKKIGFKEDDIITYGVQKIYEHYGLNIDDFKELKFDE